MSQWEHSCVPLKVIAVLPVDHIQDCQSRGEVVQVGKEEFVGIL